MPEGKAAEVSGSEQTAEGTYGLKNPRIDNGVTTWDCIYFGSYPQSDYIPQQAPEDAVSGKVYEDLDGTKMVYSQWRTVETIEGESKVVDCTPGYSKIEPIKWRVLSVEGNDAFLMADQDLDCRQYNEEQMGVTWERCTLRSWLNGYGEDQNGLKRNYSEDNFLNNAFTETERDAIMTVTVENTQNPIYYTDGGNNTEDRVYLLSYDELNDPAYGFETSENTDTRKAEATQYAKRGGGIQSPNVAVSTVYWTRSPGVREDCTCAVIGGVFVYPYKATYTQMLVRPVLHLNLAASQGVWTKADCVTGGTPAATGVPTLVPTSEAAGLPSSIPTLAPTDTPVATMFPSSIPSSEPVNTPGEITASPTITPVWLKPDIVYDAADLPAFAERTKDEAEQKYAEVKNAAPEYKETDAASFYDIQPSFEADYYLGKLSKGTLKAMISLCNYYRWLVGAEEARGDTEQTIYVASEWNKLQHQAYMWSFLTKPEDFPEEKWLRPDTAYYEFEQGNSPLEAIKNAVNTKCDSWDRNTYCGYSFRRDIISPGNGDVWLRMGYSGNWLALQRVEGPVDDSSDSRPAFYSYPSQGYMPNDLLTVDDTAWSVMVNQKYLTIPCGNDISVTLHHKESGKTFERSMKAGNAYACVDGILFEEPADEGMSVYNGTYDVEVTGLLDKETGKGAKIHYTVKFFEAGEIPSIGPGTGDGDSSGKDSGKEDASGKGSGTEESGGNDNGSRSSNDSTVSGREDDRGQNVNGNEKKIVIPNVGKVKNIRIKRQKNSVILQ